MYNQSLVKVIEPVKKTTITRLNRGKKWKYGYNKENDIVVISKTGMIGEIIEIQNLKIALPKQPKEVLGHVEDGGKSLIEKDIENRVKKREPKPSKILA